MKRNRCFSIVVVSLFIFIHSSVCFSQDDKVILPIISEDSILVANNLESSSESKSNEDEYYEEELDEDELDELDEDLSDSQLVADPLYYFNYGMYAFNDVLYFGVLKPVATGYKFVTPGFVRQGVNNFFHNLLFPVRFVNNLLQGEIKDAGSEIGIFLINTTVGVLGFGQVAQNAFDIHTADEDFGQTLGSYSIGNGFYLVLPIFGPSTLRDSIGSIGDYFLTPVNYVRPWELSTGLKVYDTINYTSLHIGDYEALKEASLDPYTAIRSAYIQNRIKKVEE